MSFEVTSNELANCYACQVISGLGRDVSRDASWITLLYVAPPIQYVI
jgi:hypothetical protein